MVPYLLGLLTIRHFSSLSVRSETVGCAFVTQPMRFYRPVCLGIILIYKPHHINLQIKSKFNNDNQLTISVSGSPKNRIKHVLICHGSATRYRSEMEMQVS